ncbi:MAG: lipopolysaccharide biosynthesis protein, partial [Roseiflexus sp.]
VRPALLGAGAMAAVVGALDSMLTGAPIVQLAALPPIGALVYLGTIWIAGREMFLEARSVLRGSLARG